MKSNNPMLKDEIKKKYQFKKGQKNPSQLDYPVKLVT